ncbi:MAG: preprotein translocase subunit YajC [Deltaproteobacteria bacterium RIFOXYD12_FULL_57_12]|nr:MAG: preprotein translocase subunit YajC [Deltaproteobacteria bacterium RIFOXYD12_FULL_57_12]
MFAIALAADGGAAGGGATGGLFSFVPLILIFVVFYFLLIRPQQKKAKEQQGFLANLKKGDAVVTNGGIYGTITGLTDLVVTLEVADNVRLKVSRQHILGSAAAFNTVKEAAPPPAKAGG